MPHLFVSYDTFLTALTRKPVADVILSGGSLVNVYTGEVYEADVAIFGERILAVGKVGDFASTRTKFIDCSGYYLVPGLLDAHIHLECSKLSVTSFSKLVVPRGTTSVVSGLDQIYVVAGLRGVRDFLQESKNTPLKIFWCIPSRLPYTYPPSTVGYRLTFKEHRRAQKWIDCYGVWETVKEFIVNGDPVVIKAMKLAMRNKLPVLGCGPMSAGSILSLFAASGVRADHESYTVEETIEKLRNGVLAVIRESSVAHFLRTNIKAITEHGISPDRFCFCTDDVISSDVLRHGHLDKLVRMAVEEGVDPVKAIQMASLNCAMTYRIDHLVGSIAPGRYADILLVDNLKKFNVKKVISNGELVASEGRLLKDIKPPARARYLLKTFKCPPITPAKLMIKAPFKSERVRVLSMQVSREVPFVRKRREAVLKVKDGIVYPDVEQDVLYVVVYPRYSKKTRPAVAFISGFEFKSGAMASSASPDDNNIICVGANLNDISIAVNKVIKEEGGQVVVNNGKILEFLPLPIGGIVSDISPEEMAEKEQKIDEAARRLGCDLPSPFMYLIFLSITAIPDYAITDRGLVDCNKLKVINPILGAA